MRLHELFLKRRSTRFDFGDMLINLLHVKLKFDEYQRCMCISDVGGHRAIRSGSRLLAPGDLDWDVLIASVANQYDSRTLMLQEEAEES
jgi:hypothetical protein